MPDTAAGIPFRSFVLRGHSAAVTAATFTDSGRWLVTADVAGTVLAWPMPDGARPIELHRGAPGLVTSLAPLPGDVVAFPDGPLTRRVRLDAAGAAPVAAPWNSARSAPVRAIAAVGDDGWIAGDAAGGLLYQYGEYTEYSGTPDPLVSLACEPAPNLAVYNEGLLAAGDVCGNVTLLDARRALAFRAKFSAASHPITGLAMFQPPMVAPLVATCALEDAHVRTWQHDQLALEIRAASAAVAISPDCWWMAHGALDEVHVRNPMNGRLGLRLRGHEGPVSAVALAPLRRDETWRGLLATGSYDGTVRVWDIVPPGVGDALVLGDEPRDRRHRTQFDSAWHGLSRAALGHHRDDARGLWMAASGLGAMEGVRALDALVEAIGREEPWPIDQCDDWLGWLLGSVNQSLHSGQPDGLRAGACLAVLRIEGCDAFAAHVGNVLVWRVRGGEALRMGLAHTVLEDAIAMAGLRGERAEKLRITDDLRWKVTRAVGVEPAVQPTFQRFHVAVGDRLVLATADVGAVLDTQTIGRLATEAASPGAAAKALVDAASGRDLRPPGALVIEVCARP